MSALSKYEYSYNHFISSPLASLKNPSGEVIRNKQNLTPPEGFASVNEILYAAEGQEHQENIPDDDHYRSQQKQQRCHHNHHHHQKQKQKFIYTIRHGKAQHNALSSEYSKPISWRFLGRLRNTFDPRLTAEGVRDAQQIGQMLRDLITTDGAPRPRTVYTSPLRRCIQTAMYAISELRNLDGNNQPQQQITLHVKEGLREWKGYDHNHQSDRRDITPNIVKLFKDLKKKLNVDVKLRVDGAQDRVDEGPMRETYVDVDRRVRRVLDDIFGNGNSQDDNSDDVDESCDDEEEDEDEEESGNCAILVLHNRSNKSVLRVMGHTPAEAHDLDLENCAALGYLVRRKKLTPTAVLARAMTEEYQWLQDREVAEREKARRHRIAAEEIAEYRRTGDAKLWRLRDYLSYWAELCDPEAVKSLVDLYALAPELKE